MKKPPTAWLSYGAGVNSTALLVALARREWWPVAVQSEGDSVTPIVRVVFSDTGDEKDETYDYLYKVAMPYARSVGLPIEVVRPWESVLARWQRLSVTGSRLIRACSEEAKIYPIKRHILAHGSANDLQLIGIHAGEKHRSRKSPKPGDLASCYPLLDLDWFQEDCVDAIKGAGLPVPVKSGCWHCPFMRVGEVVHLAISAPGKFRQIVALEDAATAKHGPQPDGTPRNQWGDRTAREWAARACEKQAAPMFDEVDPPPPCECYDGEVA